MPGSGSKVHLPLLTHINGEWFGAPEAGVDMQFDFAQLVAHAAKTRPLSAGHHRRLGHRRQRGHLARARPASPSCRTVETLRNRQAAAPRS